MLHLVVLTSLRVSLLVGPESSTSVSSPLVVQPSWTPLRLRSCLWPHHPLLPLLRHVSPHVLHVALRVLVLRLEFPEPLRRLLPRLSSPVLVWLPSEEQEPPCLVSVTSWPLWLVVRPLLRPVHVWVRGRVQSSPERTGLHPVQRVRLPQLGLVQQVSHHVRPPLVVCQVLPHLRSRLRQVRTLRRRLPLVT